MPKIPDAIVVTGFPTIDALLAGNMKLYGELMRSMTLPIMSVVVGSAAYLSRIHRGSVIGISNSDYISFARVAGVKSGTLTMKHIMKPSFIPSLTVYGLMVSFMLTNLFLVESIFRYPGFAWYGLNVIRTKDAYGIMGVSLVFGVILAAANTLVDIGVAWLDPRIRLKVSE
jgi:peptide/nickel transport system permease protein